MKTTEERSISYSRATWQTTCESLQAIIEGMAINDEDSILAVGGSGDQALAMIEFARHVTIADPELNQIELIRYRIERIKSGDTDVLFRIKENNPSKQSRDEYFRAPRRLDKIAKNIGNLTVLDPIGIDRAAYESGKDKFNKIYASNALTVGWMSEINIIRYLEKLAKKIPVGGLIYSTTPISHPPRKIEISGTLTERARKIQAEHNRQTGFGWNPTVYQRI